MKKKINNDVLIADRMLGDLARWLRLGGISIELAPDGPDEKVISIVKKRKATLLTQDVRLAHLMRNKELGVLLIPQLSLDENLLFTAYMLGIKLSPSTKICTSCNGKLIKTAKSAIKNRVPPGSLREHVAFYTCNNCGKVYWKGTHWEKIRKRFKLINSVD